MRSGNSNRASEGRFGLGAWLPFAPSLLLVVWAVIRML